MFYRYLDFIVATKEANTDIQNFCSYQIDLRNVTY